MRPRVPDNACMGPAGPPAGEATCLDVEAFAIEAAAAPQSAAAAEAADVFVVLAQPLRQAALGIRAGQLGSGGHVLQQEAIVRALALPVLSIAA